MPIRYTNHNKRINNRKQAKAWDNKVVGFKWKSRQDVLTTPYDFDHDYAPRTHAGSLNRSYYEFSLRKNKTLLVVDVHKLSEVYDYGYNFSTWYACEQASAKLLREPQQQGVFSWILRKNSRTKKNYLCITISDDVVYDQRVQDQLENFARTIFRNIRNSEHNARSANKQEIITLDPIQKLQ